MTELFFRQQGSGKPLVLLHGNGEDSSYFSQQIAWFSRAWRVIAIDTRGHGRSPRGDAPFTLAQFAEDLHAFLEREGLRRIQLLGFSDGANVALLFSLRYPQYVEKLVLNGANLSPGGVRLRTQLPIVLGYGMTAALAPFSARAAAKKELLGLMVTQPHIDPARLAALPMPVLVIAGTRDMIRRRHTERIHRAIPGSRLCLLEGDHFIASRRSEAFNRAVEAFLLDAPAYCSEGRGEGREAARVQRPR